jgi:hypothetical protein
MVLLGDGVAANLGPPLASAAAAAGAPLVPHGRPGCGITDAPVLYAGTDRLIDWTADCASSFHDFVGRVLSEDAPDTVVWLSTWETGDHLVGGAPLRFGTPAADRWLLAQMDALRAQVVARGARLVVVTNAPIATTSPYYPADDMTRFPHLNDLYYRFALRHASEVGVADLAQLVCGAGPPCPNAVGGVALRGEGDIHLLPSGADWVAPRLLPLIVDAVRGIDTMRAMSDVPEGSL